MERLGVDEDMPLDQKMLSNAIENAQKQVESRNFQMRKNVLEYDDVMNTQREVIYQQRRQVLDGEDVHAAIDNMLTATVAGAAPSPGSGDLSPEEFRSAAARLLGVFTPQQLAKFETEAAGAGSAGLADRMLETARDNYAKKEAYVNEAMAGRGPEGTNAMRELERVILLRVVDEYWMEHIDAMNELKQGIHLRAYGQSDPKVEYKREGFDMFEQMIAAIQEETVRRLFTVRIKTNEELKRERVARITGQSGGTDGTVKKQPVKKTAKIGRNDPCPCGSGLKWKKCTCAEYHKEA